MPTILIEAKWCGENLEKYDSQLFRYFTSTNAKFAILTNGLIYRFYTDLDEKNKMDEKPFLEINMLELKESQIQELRKFCKDKFDVSTIFNAASELKYTGSIKQKIIDEFTNPSDRFVRLLVEDAYDGVKTQKVVDDFKIIVKKSFNQYINELINDRLKTALESEREAMSEAVAVAEDTALLPVGELQISVDTTEGELQAFYIVKSMLIDIIPLDSVTYKDTETYFAILFENNTRKWICRLKLGEKSKNLILPSTGSKAVTMPFERLEDLYLHKSVILESAIRFKKD